jgi:hypothetical protein
MGFDISTHFVRRVKAEVNHKGASHWVTVFAAERDGARSEATYFFDSSDAQAERKADALASAINKADAELHPVDAVLERSLEWVREEMGR